MSFFKRAWLYISRKKIKAVILFGVLLCMSTVMLSAVAIKKSATLAKEQLDEQAMTGFTLRNNWKYNPGDSRGNGNIPAKSVEEILKQPYIRDHARRIRLFANILNASPVESGEKSELDERNDKRYGKIIDIQSINNSALDNKFRLGTFTLKEGRHLRPDDKYKALVHEDFAKANKLRIGSKIKLKANPNNPDNFKKSTAETEVEIVGTFSGKGGKSVTTRLELYENTFMTDLATARLLNGYTAKDEIYSDVIFYVKKARDLNSNISDVAKLPVDWKKYEVIKNNSNTPGIDESSKEIENMASSIITFTFIFSSLIIALILFLWMNGRKAETGVLLAIGTSKENIILQYMSELVMIAVLSFGLCYFTGSAIAQNIGNQVVNQAKEQTVKRIQKGVGTRLGANAETAAATKTISTIDVKVEPTDILQVALLGLGVIVVATLLSSGNLIRKTPKELLSEID